MNPCISIIIPCYNHGLYLEETIQSVERSVGKYPVEIIIVNDGSTDPFTLDVFKKIESQGFFVLHQENQGLGKARNNGIRVAKGKYILPLDSDNNVTFHYLTTAIDLLEKDANIGVVYGDAKYLGEKTGVWKNHELDLKEMLFFNHIDACAIFKKDVWVDVGGYAEDMPYMGCEDWNFWLKTINRGFGFYYLNENCFEYRILSNSMIRTIPEDFKSKIWMYNIKTVTELYALPLKEEHDKFENIFHGNILKKCIKLILNHFNLYKY